MKSRVSVLTLGVSNLENSLAFYRDGLGLPTKGIIGRNVLHRENVDDIIRKAQRAGAEIIKKTARYLLWRLRRLFCRF